MIKYVWVDNRITGKRAYQVYIEDLQELLDSFNAVVYYKKAFYERLEDIPLEVEHEQIYSYGLPTNCYITMAPTITIVPKGTTIRKWYIFEEFVFPK